MAKEKKEPKLDKEDYKTKALARAAALEAINKAHGENSAFEFAKHPLADVEAYSTGSLGLDVALGVGGYPKGRIIEIYGAESCLTGDTQITVWSKEHTTRTLDLKTLYAEFFVAKGVNTFSYHEIEDNLVQNTITDVVCVGIKPVSRLRTAGGSSIVATLDHEFFTGQKFAQLADLSVGGTVAYVDPDTLEVLTTTITSITPAGEELVYDVKMSDPHRNFVANGLVVHNCGKTTLTLHAIAAVQKAGGHAAFIDAEHALDPAYARNLGVDMDSVVLAQPESGEQALSIVETLVSSGGFDIVVVDSVAALVPQAEIDGDMGDHHVGLQARLMSQAMRKLAGLVSSTNTILIFINQTRMKIGVQWGDPTTTTGGNALKFYASVRLQISRVGTIKTGAGDKEESVGNRTRVKVVKNKVAPPFREVEFDIIFGKGISYFGDIIELGLTLGMIEKSGSWYSYRGEKIGQGVSKAADYLQANPAVAELLDSAIRKHYGIKDSVDATQ